MTSTTRPFTQTLADVTRPDTVGFRSAWFGMEPTFTSARVLNRWRAIQTDKDAVDDDFFESPRMLRKQRKVAKEMLASYRAAQERGETWCLFDEVERAADLDQWHVKRQNLHFSSKGCADRFTVRFGMDPETFEYSIKPVPVQWLYDARFVRFLQELVWDVPQALGLRPFVAGGGCQFSLSAKTYLTGSLLCDDITDKFNHPELSTWFFDVPSCDDRTFRATGARRAAFLRILEQYKRGSFHPRARGTPTAEDAILDRGFQPNDQPPTGLMDPTGGPIGSAEEVFQTNFAFGRAVRLYAQAVHPGYWQAAHPDLIGYRPDQIMRYSEGNLNRLRISGELHVKSGQVLDGDRVPELLAPLCPSMLYDEASWENRAQYSRSTARDFVEAILLDVHRAMYLQKNPGLAPVGSLLQDQLMADAEHTLRTYGAEARLEALQKAARATNLEDSGGRIKSSFVEPETLFWEAWKVLPPRERAAIAREAIQGLIDRVQTAATCDPRRTSEVSVDIDEDAMEWHRHRVSPVLWQALKADPAVLADDDPVRNELQHYLADPDRYLTRRPAWSPVADERPPWE